MELKGERVGLDEERKPGQTPQTHNAVDAVFCPGPKPVEEAPQEVAS